jgi:hypothetical protein
MEIPLAFCWSKIFELVNPLECLKQLWMPCVGRNDMDKGRMLKESHTYEKRPTKMQQASHNQTTNKILSHFYQLI